MNKTRLTVGVRRGIYDPEREMFSVPTGFDSDESAQRALKSISESLADLSDVAARVAIQNIVTVRPETFESYDEAGSFPRLYEARKQRQQMLVLQVDLPEEAKKKDAVKRTIDEHNLKIIDEGVPAERTLIFLW